MASSGWPSPWRPNSSRLLTTPSLLAPMSTRISSLSMRTTWPSTTSPCLKLLMSESCSASSSSIVVGSGPSVAPAPAPPRRRSRRARRRSRRRSACRRRPGPAVAAGRVRLAVVGRRRRVPPSAVRAAGSAASVAVALGVGWGVACGSGSGCGASSACVGGCEVVGAGGGLVGDGDRRDAVFGRLVGDGGDGLRLRRGPALLLFGQGVWSLLVVDLRPRITNGLSDAQAVSETIRGGPW